MRRAAVLALLVAACGGSPAVHIGTEWPASPSGYDATYERWTRHAVAREAFDTVLDVTATLKSAEWRAAWVETQADRLLLPADEKKKLIAEQRAAAEAGWEVELVVATPVPTWQDFGGGRSMWRIALVGDGGREVTPTAVRADWHTKPELDAWFPALRGTQRRAYVVTFPKNAADGQPLVAEGAPLLRLKVAGVPGHVVVDWRGR